MSKPATRRIKYTGKEKTSSLIDNSVPVEWKPGEIKDVVHSKVRNHVKYPWFEEVADAPVKSKSVERRQKVQKEAAEKAADKANEEQAETVKKAKAKK